MVPRPDRADVVTMGRPGFPCSAVRPRGFPRPSMMTRRVLSLRGRDIPARGAGSCRAGSGLPRRVPDAESPTRTRIANRVAPTAEGRGRACHVESADEGPVIASSLVLGCEELRIHSGDGAENGFCRRGIMNGWGRVGAAADIQVSLVSWVLSLWM
jgi:hypothetical protein